MKKVVVCRIVDTAPLSRKNPAHTPGRPPRRPDDPDAPSEAAPPPASVALRTLIDRAYGPALRPGGGDDATVNIAV